MRRFMRRVIVITIGLMLGWNAAGFVSQGLAGDTAASQDSGHGAVEGHDEHGSGAAAIAAAQLVPDPGQVGWFPAVRTGAVLFFVMAVLIGVPALLLKAPDPPDPAAHDH